MSNSIIVCGEKFNIGTKVVLWDELRGLNGYDVTKYTYKEQDRKTGKIKKRVVKGKRYSKRKWNIKRNVESLKKVVSQLFIHHDGLYRSSTTFHVLHVERGLSCHFLLDDDGTIYQTLDLFEKAWHGGNCNPMSIGVEIASRAVAGRLPTAYDNAHQKKYHVMARKKNYDRIHNQNILGYEYNDKQYVALIKLASSLSEIFPLIGFNADFPRDGHDKIMKTNLSNPKNHKGFICHYQASRHKIDPISFDHERFITGLRTNNPYVESTFSEEVYFSLSTVSEIQEVLISFGYKPGIVDGIMGKRTKAAIKQFQRDNNLVDDGAFGINTKNAMLKLCLVLWNGKTK